MNRLKKIGVLFLVLVVTFPGEVAHAFTIVPKFIKHYEHHNEEHHKVSFIQFIGEHLTTKEQHDKHERHRNDQDDQENCPFSHNHVSVQLVYIFKKDPLLVLTGSTEITDPKKSQIPAYRFTFSEYSGSIWQPPKIG
jgi:hypothetical protein